MTDSNAIDGVDYESMSSDELETIIEQKMAEGSEDKIEQEPTNQTQQEVEEPQTAQTESDTPDKPDEQNSIYNAPFYAGKTREEIIDMQENAKRHIANQGNELHKLRQSQEETQRIIREMQAQLQKKSEPQQPDPFAEYDPDDLKIIESVALNKAKEYFSQIENQKLQQIENARIEGINSNEQFWGAIKVIYPDLPNEVVNKILDDAKTNPEETFHKKDWLKNNFNKYYNPKKVNNSLQTDLSNSGLLEKKLKATTVSTTPSTPRNGQKLKTESEMTSEEYLQAMRAKGFQV